MSDRYSDEAKAKELESRKAMGPRIPRSPRAKFKPTTPSKTPKHTGAPPQARRG